MFLLLLTPVNGRRTGRADTYIRSKIKAVIPVRTSEDGFLLAGANYELLKLFASEHLAALDVSIGPDVEENADIVVIPLVDSSFHIEKGYSIPLLIEGRSAWAIRHGKSREREIAGWFGYLNEDGRFADIMERYSGYLRPFSRPEGTSPSFISPYDKTIKACSRTLGWDWRLLCALFYAESKFRMEVVSPKGAVGIAQIVPVTAGRYGVSGVPDPDENIRAATNYLLRLNGLFKSEAEGEDLQKIVLAAYNAGEGRIRDCIEYTRERGGDPSSWESIASEMRMMHPDSLSADSKALRHGAFNGGETIALVESVFASYDWYSRTVPF